MLDLLATRYWMPVHEFLRCQGVNEHEAQDLTQDFFAFALESRLFEKVDPRKGRFRSFLLGALRHFVAKVRRRDAAQKRRPRGGFVALHEVTEDSRFQVSPAGGLVDPDAAYHHAWLCAVVQNVLGRLEEEFARMGRRSHFELLMTCVAHPILAGTEKPPLEGVARRHGLDYRTAANRIGTAKRAFRRLVRREVARYAFGAADADAEANEVLHLLGLEKGEPPP